MSLVDPRDICVLSIQKSLYVYVSQRSGLSFQKFREQQVKTKYKLSFVGH